jgi:hypothetical protein
MFDPAPRPLFVALLSVLAFVAAPLAFAGPPEDELGDLAEGLDTRITTEFLDTPMDRVVEYLQRESGVTFVIDPGFAGAQIEDIPVSLKLSGHRVYDVLELIALATDADWLIRGQVVMLSSDTRVIEQRVVSGSYNLRGLMVHIPQFTNSPEMDLDETLSNTNSGGSSAGGGGAGGGGSGAALFGDGSDLRNTGTQDEFMDMIVDLVQNSMGGDPDLWLDEVFTARTVQGMLIVRATPEVHAEIEAMLADLDRSLSQMLAVEAHYLVVPRSVVDGLDGEFILDREQCDAFLERLDNGNTRRIGAVRTVCHNGQRVYTTTGENRGFISDAEPIPDTTSVDPTISVARSGNVTDLTPTVAYDRQSIEVAVRSEIVHAMSMETTPVPVASSVEAGGEAGHAGVGEVQLGLVSQQLTRFRTNARIPDGGAVVLTASTNVFEGIDADQFEVILVVRARVLEGAAEE